MIAAHLAQYLLFLGIVTACVGPAGAYMARVFEGRWTPLDPLLRPVEKAIYRVLRVTSEHEMSWLEYSIAFICFSAVGTLALYGLLRGQQFLPGGPEATYLTTPITPDLAMNTAVSFSTTTTWQAYAGETTMRYLTQTIGLVGQNFMAGAAGLAIGIAFIRGFARTQSGTLGNFWVDLVRATFWVLLPLSLVGSVLLVAAGVPMNFHPYTRAAMVQGGTQIIAQGPVAALEFIKNLGTNGGGFFNANGAHPFENPTGFSNFIEMLAIAVLPAALTGTFGRMIGRPKAGWALYGVMVFLFVAGLIICDVPERAGNPRVGDDPRAGSEAVATLAGGNMEGKETRFGIGSSVLAVVTTSNGATGSSNCTLDSLTPIGSAVPLSNMLLGEIVFGGLGTGLYSMIVVALVGLFVAGLMVGRTPEYVGKRIGQVEIKRIMVFTLITPLAVLPLAAIAVCATSGLAGLTTNTGPHGLSEVLFAYASCCANNGQTMAGLSVNSPFYNVTTAIAMLAGRFGLAVPALALAGALAHQGRRVATAGTLPSDSLLFAVVAVGSAVIIGALNFLPAMAVGPALEHFLMHSRHPLY
jgi:K+-transporting ATPase ATPase A chain